MAVVATVGYRPISFFGITGRLGRLAPGRRPVAPTRDRSGLIKSDSRQGFYRITSHYYAVRQSII